MCQNKGPVDTAQNGSAPSAPDALSAARVQKIISLISEHLKRSTPSGPITGVFVILTHGRGDLGFWTGWIKAGHHTAHLLGIKKVAEAEITVTD